MTTSQSWVRITIAAAAMLATGSRHEQQERHDELREVVAEHLAAVEPAGQQVRLPAERVRHRLRLVVVVSAVRSRHSRPPRILIMPAPNSRRNTSHQISDDDRDAAAAGRSSPRNATVNPRLAAAASPSRSRRTSGRCSRSTGSSSQSARNTSIGTHGGRSCGRPTTTDAASTMPATATASEPPVGVAPAEHARPAQPRARGAAARAPAAARARRAADGTGSASRGTRRTRARPPRAAAPAGRSRSRARRTSRASPRPHATPDLAGRVARSAHRDPPDCRPGQPWRAARPAARGHSMPKCSRSASFAAHHPFMPCTAGPGGVALEQRYTPFDGRAPRRRRHHRAASRTAPCVSSPE